MTNPYKGIKTAIIYGAGSGGSYCFRLLEEEGIEVKAFIDDFSKESVYFGKPIIKVEDLDKYQADAYFIGTGHSFRRISNYYEKLKNKVNEDKIYIHAKVLESDRTDSEFEHNMDRISSKPILVIDTIPRYTGGVAVVYKIAKLFQDKLNSITFSDKLARRLKNIGNNYVFVDIIKEKFIKPNFLKNIFYDTINLIKILSPSLVILNTPEPMLKFEDFENIKFVLWFHDVSLYRVDKDYIGYIKQSLEKKTLSKIVLSSKLNYETFLNEGFKEEHLYLIPYWIDVPRDLKPRKYPENRFKVGWLSRFEKEKGWRDLVEALKDTDIKVDFLGYGTDFEIAKSLKQEQNLKNMNFLGWVEDAYNYLRENVDLFVFTSYDILQESFGLVQAEAMSVGLPIISHNIPPSRYVLGEKGLFYKTPEELRNLIFRLKENKSFYEERSAYYVERVKEFSTEKAKERWYNLFKELGVEV